MKEFFSNGFSKREGLITFALLLLAIGFRFWMLGYASFGTDSMEFYKLALHDQRIVELWKNPPWMNQIPLNETLSLLMVKMGLPATPFVVRLPFAVMGVLALFFVWRLARRWFGSGPAILTLIFAVFNPYQIYFSRTAYHYSGAVCWSAALFLAFWSIWESFQRKESPSKKQWLLWFIAAAAACHMHMSVWIVVGFQGLLLLILAIKSGDRKQSLVRFFVVASVLGVLMSRWIIRAVQEIIKVSGAGGGGQIGDSAVPEFLRLLPAYFAGENGFAVALLFVVLALALYAVFHGSDQQRRYRSLAWICGLHIVVLMLYVAAVGGGIAKITYFSSIWPQFILLVGVGSFFGIQKMVSERWQISVYAVLAASYIALTAWPAYAIVRLEGSPTPYYKINDWVLRNLPEGTPVLTDRWFEPWNELAVHNPGTINYTFTVPDDPIASYRQFNWRKTVEAFFEKYPDAAFLEMERGKFESTFGPWDFPRRYFARCASVTNDSVMILRKMKVFPLGGFSVANTNRIVTQIFYNTTEDLLVAARRDGRNILRLYKDGWGYAKPGWQQGQFEDYRVLRQSASIEMYNLREVPMSGTLDVSAATAARAKAVAVKDFKSTFPPGRMRTWSVPLILQPGCTIIPFTSPSDDPLFVVDIRWTASQP